MKPNSNREYQHRLLLVVNNNKNNNNKRDTKMGSRSPSTESILTGFSLGSLIIIDDVVYNQAMGPGATLDKRRPDLRDELGYIAPPNRKLPPVPGSNYNTCDRIKRGTVISKDQFSLINLLFTIYSLLVSSCSHVLMSTQCVNSWFSILGLPTV